MAFDKDDPNSQDAKSSQPVAIYTTQDGNHIILTPQASNITKPKPQYIFNIQEMLSDAEKREKEEEKVMEGLKAIQEESKDLVHRSNASYATEFLRAQSYNNNKRDGRNQLQVRDHINIKPNMTLHHAMGPALTTAVATAILHSVRLPLLSSRIGAPVAIAVAYGTSLVNERWPAGHSGNHADQMADLKNV